MRKLKLIFFLITVFTSLKAQKTPLVVAKYEQVQKVWLDINENSYLINNKNELLKYDKNWKLLGQFSDFKINEKTQLYTISPFKTLLFYPEFGEIITFDNFLSEIARVSYFDIGLMNLSTIGVSEDYQSIWVFDPVNQALTQYNQNYIKLREGEKQINMIGYPIYPDFLFVRNTSLYLYDEEGGFHVFDIFGNYVKPLPIHVGNKFQVIQNVCYYLKDNSIHTIDLLTLKEGKSDMKFDNDIKDFYYAGKLLGVVDVFGQLTVWRL